MWEEESHFINTLGQAGSLLARVTTGGGDGPTHYSAHCHRWIIHLLKVSKTNRPNGLIIF